MRVLIAGGGQVGALIARRLVREGNDVTIVDLDPARCRLLEEQLDARVVQGSAARVETMRRAGIADAEMFIAVSSVDEVNVLAWMIAQAESRARVRVARLRTHEIEHWRRVLAAVGVRVDFIIHPETDIADRIMRVVHVPGVSDIIEFAEGRVRLFGMNIEAGSPVAGRTLEELDRLGPPKHSLIAMIFRGQQVIIPHGAETLRDGDHVYIVTRREDLRAAMRFMGLETELAVRRAFIVGGKQIGILVAQRLESDGVSVKLFEQDQARAERIAGILRRSVVVHADGTDQAVLEEEGIEGADAFLALTNDDEDNIIASLLARRLGVRKVVALINRLNYLPMAQRLGVNTTVSPRLATVDRILQFVRHGRVLSVTTFREEEAEAIELIATAGTKYVGRPLRELRFPRGAIVGAIVRPDGSALVLRGGESIQPGDRVIFFALERVVPDLESAFLAASARVQER
jgi:trk system potassium uptake protein TrkA